jgi:hypothetical protein
MTIQTTSTNPRFAIDCVLANVGTHLEADGCVLECVEDGHRLSTPDHLRVGDTVIIQLWLEDEESFIDIQLAVITRIQKHWLTVEVIRVSQDDRMRLKQFTLAIEKAAHIDHLLIRA